MAEPDEVLKVPHIADFVRTTPPYQEFPRTEDNDKSLASWASGRTQFDCYCIECNRDSIFQIDWLDRINRAPSRGIVVNSENQDRVMFLEALKYLVLHSRTFTFRCTCTRAIGHEIFFTIYASTRKVTKIGQIPSMSDLAFSELRPFRPVISSPNMKELRQALLLGAHGVGIGSFVYLRRVFERIVNDHHDFAAEEGRPIEGWDRMPMADRVSSLRDYLPEFLSKNASIYGILSKGIHQLAEEECLAYFPVLRDATFLILDYDSRKRIARARENELARSIGAISTKER